MLSADILRRHQTSWLGPAPDSTDRPTLILAHGIGCDQQIWASVADALTREYPVVLFDHIGCGRSDRSAFDAERYADLSAYAEDLIELVQALGLERRPILVGHSVSGAIGWLASIVEPGLFRQVIAIGPSPRYINDPPDYYGGFELEDVHELLDLMERNHFEWAGYLAPIVMANGDRPALAEQLRQSFLNADPAMSRRFAETTFFSDIRDRLSEVQVPTLMLYCEQDVIVPPAVIEYLEWALPKGSIRRLDATGHYPQVSNPEAVARAVIEGAQHAT
ncbi:alpha/beta hydrolase [Marinimicrobium sp. C6131]|uniref:alpha/beta fold hydrolase n=1 Tax=Marinimicrobium sp. C6131 TaxID=3022676 RepID=UPI00223D4426|nr:alpha/beta hydrolase [Marinimicrobium sp. C6131]UZJ43593.1 alpha/beta hydrolase [Marinimicrobium sp. C6131]